MTGLGSSCGACKFLRRKCTSECIFAPYFCYDQAATHFAAVHRVFGASNVSKLLLHLPVDTRSDAALSISYEALARMRDPIYGCVAHIFALQEQVVNLQEEIEILAKQMVNLGFGFTSPAGPPQVTTNDNASDIGLQFSHSLNMNNLDQFYQNHQEPLLFHMGNTQANQGFNLDGLTDAQFPPFYGGDEEHNPFCDSEPILLDGLFEGVESEIFTCYPWLNNNGNNNKVV